MAANEAIELAYKNDPRNRNHVVFYGSDFDNSLLKIGPEVPFPVPNRRPSRPGVAEVRLPKGVPNQRFGNLLLQELRGLERQRRPDIIDFTSRAFYEIKSTGYADRGTVQLRSYYKITETILMHHGQSEPPWKLDTAPPWYPDHVLAMLSPNPQSLRLVVCTRETNHTKYPGMVIYDVRRLSRRRRRRQRPTEIHVNDFWSEYNMIRPMVRASLPKAIPFYDPDSPDYVIIVPHEFFSLDFVKRLTKEIMNRRWESFRVQPEFSRNRMNPTFSLTPETILMAALILAAAGVVAVLVVMTGGAILEGLAAGATALTSAEVGATAATGTAAGVESTIVVPASIAAQVAGGTSAAATTAEAATIASYEAMLASPIAQRIAASAGVAVVLSTATSVQADSSDTAKATIDQIIPIRVIPIDDFNQVGNMPHAFSVEMDRGLPDADKTKFDVGRQVFFDNKLHWIFGRLSVR